MIYIFFCIINKYYKLYAKTDGIFLSTEFLLHLYAAICFKKNIVLIMSQKFVK